MSWGPSTSRCASAATHSIVPECGAASTLLTCCRVAPANPAAPWWDAGANQATPHVCTFPTLAAVLQLRQLDAWYREETERWSAEREELCRKCSQLEQRHTQWQHELRRRDVEFEKLQKHLATQISATERRRRVSSSGTGTSSSSSAANSTLVLTSSGTGNGSSTSTRSSR